MKEFVMRGKTDSGKTEVLNFSGFKPGKAYKLTDFELYPFNAIGDRRIFGSVTAGSTAVDPSNSIDFNNEGLIAVSMESYNNTSSPDGNVFLKIVNDTFLITQNLILMVFSQGGEPINWQCRFEPVKMSGAEEAVTNYKQYLISDE
tara:strand:- start:40 stop:477 length:438 start_codon:yes stop_codon:yes gene_type:complete